MVLGGCGSAVLAAAFPGVCIGLHGVSLAFGLTVITMAFAISPISGCHLNPAVTVGLAAAGRHPWSKTWQYIIAQICGGIAGAAILWRIASGKADVDLAAGGFDANGYGERSPGKYSMMAALVCGWCARWS